MHKLNVPNKEAALASLEECSTVQGVLRVQHRVCRRHRAIAPSSAPRVSARPLLYLRTAGITDVELRLCQKMYPGVRLAQLDRRTRAVRGIAFRLDSPRAADTGPAQCVQCNSSNVRFDDVTSDLVCRNCGWCKHTLCPTWHEPTPAIGRRAEDDCARVLELFFHVCDRFRLGPLCRDRACFLYRKCRRHLQHLEKPEYVECACLVLAMRSRPKPHNLCHAK